MTKETIVEAVLKLIGEVEPVGETHEDNKRYENLKILEVVYETLTRKLVNISNGRHDNRDSVAQSGKLATRILQSASTKMSDTLGDYKLEMKQYKKQ